MDERRYPIKECSMWNIVACLRFSLSPILEDSFRTSFAVPFVALLYRTCFNLATYSLAKPLSIVRQFKSFIFTSLFRRNLDTTSRLNGAQSNFYSPSPPATMWPVFSMYTWVKDKLPGIDDAS